MVRPVKGSGIGAVNIPEILTGKPKILQGLGTAIAPPVKGGGFIGLSEVPASGLPNIMPSETSILEPEDSGFSILTPRAKKSGTDFLTGIANLFKPSSQGAQAEEASTSSVGFSNTHRLFKRDSKSKCRKSATRTDIGRSKA